LKILIAEDDPNILSGLSEIFEAEGYQPILAADGLQAIEKFNSERPDFVCLDIMMPGKSGYDVCREIRKSDSQVPVIFLSAKSEEIDKVLGLELGADDYITKPFGVREVIARIRAVTRRHLSDKGDDPSDQPFKMNDLEIFPNQLRAQRGDQTIDLSLRDVKILQVLFDHPGQAVHRDTLFQHVWGYDHLPNSRTLDQHISQLRKRIEQDPKSPAIIRTVHNVGYRYESENL
jgi:DNA-binding response OmpR family regulator